MKLATKIALACALLIAYVCCSLLVAATPTPTPLLDISTIDFSKISEADIEETEAHRDKLLQDAKDASAKEKQVIDSHASTLNDIKVAGNDASKAFDLYRKSTETQLALGNKAILAAAHLTMLLHRAKWIMCGLWVALCAFIALQLQKVPILGQYALYGVGALAIGGIAFIWAWL
jgi:hypothetical protein